MTTIYDIAKAAGVTAMTVSNVLSGKNSVSAATRERVMKYVRELDYRPNLVARSLIKGRTGTIGFVVPTLENPFYAELINRAEEVAYKANLRIFLTSLAQYEDVQLNRYLLQDMMQRRVDGILVAPAVWMQVIDALEASHPPIVHCMWEGEPEKDVQTFVSFDLFLGAQLVAEHLLQLGHRRFGLVTHAQNSRLSRRLAFQETLLRYGATLPFIEEGDSTPESGKVAGLKLLSHPLRPTAIFATNDVTAFGVMTAAWELGLRIPQDISIVGFDDISLSAYTLPPLTTVRLDSALLMEKSLEVLLQQIDGRNEPIQILLRPSLVVRSSTAPPIDP